jgi:hypothetical protein
LKFNNYLFFCDVEIRGKIGEQLLNWESPFFF